LCLDREHCHSSSSNSRVSDCGHCGAIHWKMTPDGKLGEDGMSNCIENDGEIRHCSDGNAQLVEFEAVAKPWEVPVGSWIEAGSASAGGFTRSITEGTSSTDSKSTTSTWAATITAKMEAGVIFEEAELDVSVSTSIAQQCSSSFTKTESETCSVSCPYVAAKPWVFVYQWRTQAKHPGDTAFTTEAKTCNYICSYQVVGRPQAPKCPWTCCLDTQCQQCNQDCQLSSSVTIIA
jgi:hypothetical protein